MRISINPKVLDKYNLSMGEFLVMLLGYWNISYEECYNNLVEKKIIGADVFHNLGIVLSDNTRELITRILTESDAKLDDCGIENFEELATELQNIYPDGRKSGTTYLWRGTVEEIAQKLRYLVLKYNFHFTKEEAIQATKEYVASFNDTKYMSLLKYFILRTSADGYGHKEINSMFMTIIENNRNENR